MYYIKNHLGSTAAVINDKGELIEATMYTAYGEQIPLMVLPGTEVEAREKFTGKEFDTEGGSGNGVDGINLDYFGKRYYDPEIARWIACDPAHQFWTPYAYTGNGYNPIGAADDDGGWVNFGVAFAAGAGLELGTQVAIGMAKGQSFGQALSNVDASDVLVTGVASMSGLGLAAKFAKFGAALKIGTSFGNNALSNVASKALNGENISPTNVLLESALATGVGEAADIGLGRLAGDKIVQASRLKGYDTGVRTPGQSRVGAEIIQEANLITGSVAGATESVNNRISDKISK